MVLQPSHPVDGGATDKNTWLSAKRFQQVLFYANAGGPLSFELSQKHRFESINTEQVP